MSSADISRKLFQPEKHYAGAIYQQGRVTLDSDQNEGALLAGEELRQLIAEAICGGGSPNGGFGVGGVQVVPRPDNPQAQTYDFDLASGSFYLGGQRFAAETGDTFLLQSDWLQIALDGGLPAPPSAADLAGGPRHDLLWLEAWEQAVTAVEDSEILERALGGPDTTARLRRTRRIHVTTNTAADCAGALAGLGIPIDAGTGAVRMPTLMTVGFDPAGVSDDPCKPATQAGFLGADNQTLRVQITAPGRLIWGQDNATPLYRVQAQPFQEQGGGTTLRTIHFLTTPPDQAHYPLAGQTVEVMRWGSLLPNGEKTAEPTGMLFTVQTSYDPDSQSVVIATPVPQAWVDWFAGAGAHALSNRDAPEDQEYFYLRLWTGGSGQAAAPDLPFAPNLSQTLGATGLTVTFSDAGRPGAFWVIAARPNTPDIVVPWALMQGLPPMGPRAYVTPLAIISWSLDANNQPVPGQNPHDCRHRFRPLCETNDCCCVVTVGDGQTSFGDVTSIQAAIDLLPDQGGRICVLRGTYNEAIVIEGRTDITIAGCGAQSLLTAPAGSDAVLTVRASSGIHLIDLGFDAPTHNAVRLMGTRKAPIHGTLLERLTITASDLAAVAGTELRGCEMRGCEIELRPLVVGLGDDLLVGRQPAVYLAGDDLLVAFCRIEGQEATAAARQPLGGVQIGGRSQHVRLRDNLIRFGNGHGITLGSVRFVRSDANGITGIRELDFIDDVPLASAQAGPFTAIGLTITIDDNGCIVIDPNPGNPNGGNPLVPVSEGGLLDVAIVDNRIEAMGLSGISVARFFDLSQAPDYISVQDLEINHNRILGCATLESPRLTGDLVVHSAIGGIALAHCEKLYVRDNRVENCGRHAGYPICGLFVLNCDGAVVERNRITGNGTAGSGDTPTRPGRRGGIVFGLALPGSFPFTVPLLNRAGLREDGAPALRVHDNIIVVPEGRALEVIAVGPVSICDNQFTTRSGARLTRRVSGPAAGVAGYGPAKSAAVALGSVATQNGDPLLAFLDQLGGVVVAVLNLGVSNELYLQVLGFSGLHLVDAGPATTTSFKVDEDNLFFGGEVMFDDNQVLLDALAADVQVAASAVLLVSLDDVGMNANQCTCDLLLDFVLTNALVLGFSVRVSDNRFKEPIGIPGRFTPAFLSALTFGLMNETTANQGTHCFYAVGAPALSVLSPNRSMVSLVASDACNRFAAQAKDQIGTFRPINAVAEGG